MRPPRIDPAITPDFRGAQPLINADVPDVRRLLAQLGDRTGTSIRRLGGRRDLVRNAHGQPLPCCWADCWARGSVKHKVVVLHDAPDRAASGDTLTYIFCGPAHKDMWMGRSGLIVP